MSYDWEGKPGVALKMHAWIRDAALALIAVADLAVAFNVRHTLGEKREGKGKMADIIKEVAVAFGVVVGLVVAATLVAIALSA